MRLFAIFFGAMIVNNILLMRFLGLCSFFGISNKLENAVSMTWAVTFVMAMASLVTWGLYHFLLLPLGLVFLRTAFFILVIAALVQLVEMYMKKNAPGLYRALGIYLPLITTNCAILAVAFLNIDYGYSLLESLVYTVGVSGGYGVAIVLFASLRERVDKAPVPEAFKGYPIAFILAGLLSLAFMGFAGMFGIQL
ncbi:MAG TPA: electron transport complex subunit RsxA [Elusimicrobia bacterium]|nr:electron transport complex subunit RsxA [Elusimicrobiota bacterium]